MQEPIFHLVNPLYYWPSIKRAGSLLGRETDRPLFLIDRRRYRTSPKKSLRNRIISSQYWEFVSNLLSKADFAQYEPPSMVVDIKSWSSFFRPCWTKHNSLRFPICWFLPQNPFVRFLIPQTWSLIFPVHIFLFSISTLVPLDCLFQL